MDARPENQLQIKGCDTALQTLAQIYENGSLAGSWLFCGRKGVGKATLAYRLARFLLAEESERETTVGLFAEPAEPLSVRENTQTFKLVAARTHPDLAVLERSLTDKELKERQALLDAGKPLDEETEKQRKRNNEIRADDVRKAEDFLHRTSASGGWRVLIVDCADEMNLNAANALLKSLEEPAPRTLIVLIAHSVGSLLPTIRSRCRKIMFKPLSDADMADLLKQKTPDLSESERNALIGISGGSIGDALFLAENNGVRLYNDMLSVFSAFPEIDIANLYGFAETYLKEKESVQAVRKLFSELLAKAVKVSAGANVAGTLFDGEENVLRRIGALPVEFLLDEMQQALKTLSDGDLDLKQVFVNACLRLNKGGV